VSTVDRELYVTCVGAELHPVAVIEYVYSLRACNTLQEAVPASPERRLGFGPVLTLVLTCLELMK
jgi:hypothetical protein